MATDRELIGATACDIIEKLKADEVTPLDVLERRIAEVDGKVKPPKHSA